MRRTMVRGVVTTMVRGAATSEAHGAATAVVRGMEVVAIRGAEVVVRGVEASIAKWRGFRGATKEEESKCV